MVFRVAIAPFRVEGVGLPRLSGLPSRCTQINAGVAVNGHNLHPPAAEISAHSNSTFHVHHDLANSILRLRTPSFEVPSVTPHVRRHVNGCVARRSLYPAMRGHGHVLERNTIGLIG